MLFEIPNPTRRSSSSWRRLRSDNPCLGDKAPSRIKPVDVIDRTHPHSRWIFVFAQCCRDALHHCRRDAPDMTRSSPVNMATENGDDPPPVLQSATEL